MTLERIGSLQDYLANEGLTVMGLFKDKASSASVHKTMVAVMSGADVSYLFIHLFIHSFIYICACINYMYIHV